MKKSQTAKETLYITSVNQETANKVNSPIELPHSPNIREMKKNTKLSSYLIKNRETFDNTTSQVLDFMVHEETQFTDLTKIEDYYKDKTIAYYDKFNENSLMINKKKKLLEDLDLQIGQELVKSIQCNVDQVEKSYEPEIEALKKSIEKQEHDLQSYKAKYDDLNEENFILRKKLQEQIKFGEISDKHFDKYNTIQQNAQRTYNMQKNLLRDMKDFEDIYSSQMEKELEKKKIICSQLEYEVVTVKKEFTKNQSTLDHFKLSIRDVCKQLEERDRKNEKLAQEYRIGIKDFIKTNTTLYLIYRNLKVKDLDSVIRKFQEERIQYQGYYSQFYNLNSEISTLNNTYSHFTSQLSFLKSKISELTSSVTEETFQELSVKLKYTNESVNQLMHTVHEKEQYLKDIFSFLEKYSKKMTDMVNSITMYALNISKLNRKRNDLLFKNKEMTGDSFWNAKDIGITECRELLSYFLKWQRKVCFIYSNFIMNVIVTFYSKTYANPWEKIFILRFSSPEVAQRVDSVVNEAIHHYEDKMAFNKKNQLGLFKDKGQSLDKKIKEFFFGRKATLDDIISHYHKHLRQAEPDHEETIDGVINSLKSKFFSTISKYTNDFVQQPLKSKMTMSPINTLNIEGQFDNLISKKGSENKKSSTNSSKSGEEKIAVVDQANNTSSNGVLQPVKLGTSIEHSTNLDDSYTSTLQEKVTPSKKVKKRNFFGYSKNRGEESQQLYKRINDLNRLELNLFKERGLKGIYSNGDGRLNNANKTNPQFSEIYFNFKKKLTSRAFSPAAKKFAKIAHSKITPFGTGKTNPSQVINLTNSYNLNLNKLAYSTDAPISTRNDTKSNKSNYIQVNTEPGPPRKSKGNKKSSAKTKTKNNFLKELLNDDFLKDNEREINTQLEKSRNFLGGKKSNGIRINGLLSAKSVKGYDYLPNVFNSTSAASSTKNYTTTFKHK